MNWTSPKTAKQLTDGRRVRINMPEAVVSSVRGVWDDGTFFVKDDLRGKRRMVNATLEVFKPDPPTQVTIGGCDGPPPKRNTRAKQTWARLESGSKLRLTNLADMIKEGDIQIGCR